jgi:acetyltransferase-like isoleucine patch superfamily enzyme/SAM-dependent methyltransferase
MSEPSDEWIERVLAPLVDARVKEALAKHLADSSHLTPYDLIVTPRIYGDERKLHMHETAVVNDALFNLSSGEISLGEYVFFAHGVSVLTGTHDITTFDRERQIAVPKSGRDVVIERGVWVSTNATVLGPCRIGEYAVVAAGSIVMGDVPPYTVVAGTPAQPIRVIDRDTRSVQPLPEPPPSGFAALHQAFQERFRGSEADVRQRLEVYLPDAEAVRTGRKVLDIGPGRGEWLALLVERGIDAYGIDVDPSMVELVQQRGLHAVHADAVRHLLRLEHGSLDMVTAFHVIEHLATDVLLAMLESARRALRPGGMLILETPDPTNLFMGACNFYLDPTHLRPMPPALTEFLVSASGFEIAEVRRLHPKDDVDLAGLHLDGVDGSSEQLLRDALVKGLFGTQDYAVVARVPE